MDIFIQFLLFAVVTLNIALIWALISNRPLNYLNKNLVYILLFSTMWIADSAIVDFSRDEWIISVSDILLYPGSIICVYFTVRLSYNLATNAKMRRPMSILLLTPTVLLLTLLAIPNLFLTFNITINQSGTNAISVSGQGYPTYAAYFVSYLIVMTILLIKARLSTTIVDKKKISGIIAAIIFTSTVSSLLTLTISKTSANSTPLWPGSLSFSAVNATILYASSNHGIFNPKPYIIRSVAYSSSIILLAGLYLLAGRFIYDHRMIVPTNLQPILTLSLGASLALLFMPLLTIFKQLSNRLFFRDNYNFEEVTEKLTLTMIKNVGLEELTDSFTRAIKTNLHSSFVKIELKEIDDSCNNAALSVDLTANNNTIGALFLGPKLSGQTYTKKDHALLKTISTQLAISVENAKLREAEINHSRNLQKKINKATRELKSANKQLSQANKQKDNFISMASHQLKSPLTATTQSIDLLKKEDVITNKAQRNEIIDLADESAKRTQLLVANMLDVAKSNEGKLKIDKSAHDIKGLVERRIKAANAAASLKGIDITLRHSSKLPKTVNIDAFHVKEVVANFLDNAIKYSGQGQTINVILGYTGKHTSLLIKDCGIGIPKEDQAKLFDKFFRASNAKGSRGGTGLGLYVAKTVIEEHGGEIVFSSKEGQGSTFGFHI